MSLESHRFTAWLSAEERKGLDRIAAEHNCSKNYVLRLALRAALGLPITRAERHEFERREREKQAA